MGFLGPLGVGFFLLLLELLEALFGLAAIDQLCPGVLLLLPERFDPLGHLPKISLYALAVGGPAAKLPGTGSFGHAFLQRLVEAVSNLSGGLLEMTNFLLNACQLPLGLHALVASELEDLLKRKFEPFHRRYSRSEGQGRRWRNLPAKLLLSQAARLRVPGGRASERLSVDDPLELSPGVGIAFLADVLLQEVGELLVYGDRTIGLLVGALFVGTDADQVLRLLIVSQ